MQVWVQLWVAPGLRVTPHLRSSVFLYRLSLVEGRVQLGSPPIHVREKSTSGPLKDQQYLAALRQIVMRSGCVALMMKASINGNWWKGKISDKGRLKT